jgi:transcription elongation factor Elf1
MTEKIMHCPKCKSEHITPRWPEHIDVGYATQYTTCNECGFEWITHFAATLNTDIYGNLLDAGANVEEVLLTWTATIHCAKKIFVNPSTLNAIEPFHEVAALRLSSIPNLVKFEDLCVNVRSYEEEK